MNAAEQLRNELRNSASFDKKKVLETVINGIKNNGGYSEIIDTYNGRDKIYYGTYHIEVATLEQEEGIKEFLLSEGFKIRKSYHPVSGRWCGYEAYL